MGEEVHKFESELSKYFNNNVVVLIQEQLHYNLPYNLLE